MDNLPKKIDDIVDDIPKQEEEIESVILLPDTEAELVDSEKDNIDDEFLYVQTNIVTMIEASKEVLENSATLAIETDSPRAVEVYAGMLKTIADLNKDLITVRDQRNGLLGTKSSSKGTTTIKNAVFVGSTQDLFNMIRGKKN